MIQIKRDGILVFTFIICVLIGVVLLTFTSMGVTDEIPVIIWMWMLVVGSALVYCGLKQILQDKSQLIVVYAGYLLRCLLDFVDVYGRNYITLLLSGGDADGFYIIASSLHEGMVGVPVLTKYPYVLNYIFKVTGDNRFLAQYINILFWILSVTVICRICRRFGTTQRAQLFILLVWSFLPTGLLLTSILLRESMEMFFGLWSFERFLAWMQEGRGCDIVKAFVYVIPAIILHSASVALWGCYFIIFLFWNTNTHKFFFQKKTGFLFVLGVLGLSLLIKSPLSDLFLAYFGSDFSLYGLTHKFFVQGGTDYLVGMDCQNWMEFIPYTIIRMFYFLFSPLPTEARGMGDMIAFLTDGLPLFVIIVYITRSFRRQDASLKGYILAALLGAFMFAFIFAWGVSNAGTALRHRYLAWPIFIVALCICCGDSKYENFNFYNVNE